MTTKLNMTALSLLPDAIAKPAFDRSSLSAGILHIGVGNFHRAHQAVYLNKLFAQGEGHDWAIVGAGLMPYDRAMRERLQKQDWLTTIVELDPDGLSAHVCASMIDFIDVDPAVLIGRLCQPDIRIVSLTITEGGYFVDPNSGGFDVSHPEILADLENPEAPSTVFGVLVAALMQRKAAGVEPFTVMSCDNLPENGYMAKQTVVGYARAMSAEVADWIEQNVAFPNGMVDCITPATGERERALIRETFDIEDAAPVVCEPFRQWVLEDKFPTGRPALEKVGVEFVSDVAPYELMKLRILNGGHAAIAYPGALLGHHFVHDAMADPRIRAYLTKLETDEILPTVPEIPGVSFHRYLDTVMERFSNSAVGDTIPRLCLDGSNRQPKFILPSIQDRLQQGQPVRGLALETALWCRYCLGQDETGKRIAVEDEHADVLQAWAQDVFSGATPAKMPDLFGPLGDDPIFLAEFNAAADRLRTLGVAGTLSDYVAPSDETANGSQPLSA
ncbi:mannitol dehydrogenase family protein [Roseibium sp. MMSF_3412]|uniref:mannitol dehydrogenase family protein n=1 Tax=Roseibium sp. MMSF_3412 TaxID=3046712 RepID=UPI00273D789D|nr:mannitol dehydrogenase family protein [Roseibium sp. MMSF_3412]